MKIAFIEFGGSHTEIVYSFSHLLRKKGCEVHLICNESILKNIPDENIVDKIKTVPDHFKGLHQFKIFSDVKKYLNQNQIEHIIIGTTEIRAIRNFSFYIRKFNTTGVVHNIKKLEKHWTSSRIGFFNIKKFIVLGKYLLDDMKPAANYKINYFIPAYFPEIKKLQPVKPENEFWAVVPGGVEQFRRDYVSLIENLDKTEFPENIRIIFLGSLWDEREQEIYRSLRNLENNKNSIITFDHFVDYDTFHSYMQQANIILPLFKTDGTDWYMNKRMSGSTPLGIAYKIPFLVPVTYRSHEDINEYSFFYEDYQDLFDKIRNLANGNISADEIKKRYEEKFSPLATDKEADRLCDFIVN